ncbi:MAG: hypothetical protein M9893_12770, partial [Pyrinomonadaceae bacterium]|nr:hypothetical protein [Pyrinomonadaceae bacterium]
MTIKFGTSGWRAIIADEFTFDNARLVTRSICGYLKTHQSNDTTLVIGNDSRFMGEKFADVAAEIAADYGFTALRCTGETPTPAISHAIRSQKAAGGINFTASHNPPEFQGIKFSTADGAPALPEVTKVIEQYIADGIEAERASGGSITEYDAREAYLNDVAAKVRLDTIADAGGSYAYDPLWGTGRGYLDKELRDRGLTVETIHDWRDVTFGGRAPEPGGDHLDELRAEV